MFKLKWTHRLLTEMPFYSKLFCFFARIHYPSCTDSIKPSLQLSCNFVAINASKGSLCFQIFILHNSRCQVLCGNCKSCPVLHFSVVVFFWSFGIIYASTIKCWLLFIKNWVPLKLVLWVMRDVARIHYPSCTDSIKPNLQFSCNFVLINASEWSLCFQIFATNYITQIFALLGGWLL
jgi:hypothetical protein